MAEGLADVVTNSAYKYSINIFPTSGIGNTKEIVDRLVRLGVLKKIDGRRSIRPVYINFRNLE